MKLIANARLYAITPETKAAWRSIFAAIADQSGIALELFDHAPPAPLEEMWRRDDLGCVFMCGWPFSVRPEKPHLLAAPVPSPVRYNDRPAYFSDLVVHKDSPFQHLEETFGGTIGWTLTDSNSGFNLPRHHLLQYVRKHGAPLYARSVGQLINPLGALRAVTERVVDVAPVDGFCHDILTAAGHPYTLETRTIATTAPSPIPALVASRLVPRSQVERIRAALLTAHLDPRLQRPLQAAMVRRFERMRLKDYSYTIDIAKAAEAAGYDSPS